LSKTGSATPSIGATLYMNSATTIATTNYVLYAEAGNSYFGGDVSILNGLSVGTTVHNWSGIHIHEASSGGAYIQVTNTTTGTGTSAGLFVSVQADESVLISNQSNTDMAFKTNATQRMVVKADGTLETSHDVIMTKSSADIELSVRTTGASNVPKVGLYTSTSTEKGYFKYLSGDLRIGNGTTDDIHIDRNNTAVITIRGLNGNVGINETSSQADLHITEGSATAFSVNSLADTLLLENSGYAGMSIISDIGSYILFGNATDGTNSGQIEYLANEKMSFYTEATKRFTVDSGGDRDWET
jgi:hypothetical protein